MREFVLVDLYSQIEFLPLYVRNGSQEAFLLWLSRHGDIRTWSRQGYTFYSFCSWWGIENVFMFPVDGDIFIQGKYLRMRVDA